MNKLKLLCEEDDRIGKVFVAGVVLAIITGIAGFMPVKVWIMGLPTAKNMRALVLVLSALPMLGSVIHTFGCLWLIEHGNQSNAGTLIAQIGMLACLDIVLVMLVASII